jgi:hypothetical protein
LNLGKLEFLLSMGLTGIASQEPELDLSGVLTRKKIDGGNFLVVRLSGSMIPFDEEPELKKMAEADEDAAKVFEKLKSENLVVTLPEPKTVTTNAGKMHVFPIPADCPVHTEVKPTVGLGKDTLVFAMTPEAAERLMTKTPLTYGGVLADAKKPRISAGCDPKPSQNGSRSAFDTEKYHRRNLSRCRHPAQQDHRQRHRLR